jgi:hypothetical protein
VIAAGVCLFACYLAEARTVVVNSDSSATLLQSWDMLHGNWLLHGWVLSDVSFYTTELPEWALASLLAGLSPNAAHVGAALTYTLLVLLAALLARGRGPGGLRSALVAGGILLAPSLGRDTAELLGTPDHLGTAVPILVVLLLIDLAPARWWVPVLAGLGLAWALIADPLTLYAACVPLAVVGAIRAIRRRSAYDAWLFVAAVASVGLARVALALIKRAGGFAVNNVPGGLLAPLSAAPHHAWITVQSVLLLFGADFTDPGSAFVRFVAVVHLVGVALALAALAIGIARFFSLRDRVSEVLVGGILVLLAAGVLGTHMANITFAHEIAAVLPLGAVLAGRLVAPLLFASGSGAPRTISAGTHADAVPARAGAPASGPVPAGVTVPAGATGAQAATRSGAASTGAAENGRPGGSAPGRSAKFLARGAAAALGAVLAVYLVGLGYAAAQPAATPASLPLASWLEAHGLHEGLSGYGEGQSVMLDSGLRIHLAILRPDGAGAYRWESQASWYDARAHDATFVIVSPSTPATTYDSEHYKSVPAGNVLAFFGRPAQTYSDDGFQIWVYNRNLLNRLMR